MYARQDIQIERMQGVCLVVVVDVRVCVCVCMCEERERERRDCVSGPLFVKLLIVWWKISWGKINLFGMLTCL